MAGGFVALTMAVPTVVWTSTPAQAATATISGGVKVSGTTYAKSGDTLQIDTSTSLNPGGNPRAKCVLFQDVTSGTPVLVGSAWNGNGAQEWSFSFVAGADSGVRTVRATPYTDTVDGRRTAGQSTGNICKDGSVDNKDTWATVTYTLANTPPAITAIVAPAPETPAAQAAWYRGDVVVTWSCQDRSGTGLKSPGCPPAQTLTGEGAGLSATAQVSDVVGNISQGKVDGINIDRHAPLTTAVAPTGWQNHQVTITLAGQDALSGVASTEYTLDGSGWLAYPGTGITVGEGQHTLSYRSTDVAGNVETAKTTQVDVDSTKPEISSSQTPAKNANNWNKSDVTVKFACSDSLSGVAACTADELVNAEGTTVVKGTAADKAGNTAETTHHVDIDRTAPTIDETVSGTPGLNGWFTSAVFVTFACNDDRSGIASCSAATPFGDGAAQGVTGTAIDAAGNSQVRSVNGINVDTVAPVTTTEAPLDWQTDDVTLQFNATDQTGLSGVAYTEYSVDGGDSWTKARSVTMGEGNHAVQFRSADAAGNVEQAQTVTVMVDRTDPTITAVPDRGPDSNDWYSAPVTFTFSCADAGGSGLADACPEPVTLEEGRHPAFTRQISDVAGNIGEVEVGAVAVDSTPPNTTASAPTGWQKDEVTVTLSAADALSGVASTEYGLDGGAWTAYTAAGIPLAEGKHTIAYRSTDVAGNVEMTQLARVDIDLTAPSITSAQNPAANPDGWNKSNVTVSFACGDNLSGVASCTTPETVTAEGDSTITGTAIDNAGRSNSVDRTVRIDKTAPTIERTITGTLGLDGWYTSDVAVGFACADDRSGVKACSPGSTLGNGAGLSVNGTATDAAGNDASIDVEPINVDKDAPSTSTNAPSGWQTDDVTLSFSATDQDGLSGVAYTEYSLDGSASWVRGTSVLLGEGSHDVLYRSADRAGNVERTRTANVRVDRSAPAVTIEGSASVTSPTVSVRGTAADIGSGLAGVTINGTPVAVTDGGYAADVAVDCGANTVTAEATDAVGRRSTANLVVQRVCVIPEVWTTGGFFAPVDMTTAGGPRVVNTVKGGSTVPLKFRVYKNGAEQKDVAVVSGMKVANVACVTGDTSAPVEQLVSGGTSLRYDGTQFIQNWKVPTVVGCYAASAQLVDGSAITAYFKVNK